MYTCEICEYNTNERTAIYHHNKTKKHLLNKNEYEKNIKLDIFNKSIIQRKTHFIDNIVNNL
jgi:hypothetical protein